MAEAPNDLDTTQPFVRRPGCQASCLTRGFASPPRGGFAFSGRGFRLIMNC